MWRETPRPDPQNRGAWGGAHLAISHDAFDSHVSAISSLRCDGAERRTEDSFQATGRGGEVSARDTGYHRSRVRLYRFLSQTPLGPAAAKALAVLLSEPDFAHAPPADEEYVCFIPHHRLDLVSARGKPHYYYLCFACAKISLGSGPALPLTEKALSALRRYFDTHRIPVKSLDEYDALATTAAIEATR